MIDKAQMTAAVPTYAVSGPLRGAAYARINRGPRATVLVTENTKYYSGEWNQKASAQSFKHKFSLNNLLVVTL